MKSNRLVFTSLALVCLALNAQSFAQSPSVLYTWSGTGNVQQWFKNFGTNTVTFANTNAGELTISETGTVGTGVAITDDFNRVRETPTAPGGGLDLTGLDNLQFDIGHNGSGNVNVQFFVQASTASTFVALGGDVAVTPGVNTYTLPLSALTNDQRVYVRTLGFNARDHVALGNLNWTLREVRSTGTPDLVRDLATHNVGSAEGGLQGALVNFDLASVAGNTGQNQTGLTHNPAGTGSLQWTDVAGGAGGAISWGNGTALNGNTFNNRTTDLSNYRTMIVRMSATNTSPTAPGGNVDVQAFFQKNNFAEFQSPGTVQLPIDGLLHDLVFTLPASLTNMNVIDQTGINLGTHANALTINVDLVRFVVPEPASLTLIGLAMLGCLGSIRRAKRHG